MYRNREYGNRKYGNRKDRNRKYGNRKYRNRKDTYMDKNRNMENIGNIWTEEGKE